QALLLRARDRQRGGERLDHDLRLRDPLRAALLSEWSDVRGANQDSCQSCHVAARVTLDVDDRREARPAVVRVSRECAPGQSEARTAVSHPRATAQKCGDVEVTVAAMHAVAADAI